MNKDIPRALSDITARAMEKDPENRFRSTRAFARELRHWLEEYGQETEAAEANLTPELENKPRGGWVVAAGLGMILGAGAAWFALTQGEQPPPPVTPAPVVHRVLPAPPPVVISEILPARVEDPASVPAPSAMSDAKEEIILDPPRSLEPAAVKAEEPAPQPMARPLMPADGVRPAPREHRRDAGRVVPREAKDHTSRAATPPAAEAVSGVVKLAVSPWGEVEIDGTAAGTVPPLTEIILPEGKHRVVVRNGDYPAFSTSIEVRRGKPVALKHRFGS